jgi:hypothetical protein
VSDLLQTGAAWLANRLADSAASLCTYHRGNSYAQVRATVGSSTFEAQSQSGVIETWQSRDFIIKTSSLPFGEPARHDTVVETIDGVDLTYEVTSPSGMPVFRYADPYRNCVRVHTIATDKSSAVLPTLKQRYWGVSALTSVTNQQIVDLFSSDLAGNNGQSRTLSPSGQHLYFVLPASFGAASFTVNGLFTSAWETTTRSITFPSQSAASYTIYRSTYAITGNAKVVVS